ncbi:MAG TPA: hypothetical protein PKD79_04205, partial [Candidatus Doudnabacteria bacterium]|nr:hypothetical protein [Candidatus Doudnabacteria bacterium]
MLKKIFLAILILIISLIFLAVAGYAAHPPRTDLIWGINYSQLRAQDLDMEPVALFQTILDDL